MLPIPRGTITRKQKAAALVVAVIVDIIQVSLWPFFFEGAASPAQDVLDVITTIILVAICGFRWQLALAFIVELIPGLDLFPTWAAFILTIPTFDPGNQFQPPAPANPTTVTATRVPPISPLAQHNASGQD